MEFEEADLDAFLNGVPKLRAPACISVCSEAVVLVFGWGIALVYASVSNGGGNNMKVWRGLRSVDANVKP